MRAFISSLQRHGVFISSVLLATSCQDSTHSTRSKSAKVKPASVNIAIESQTFTLGQVPATIVSGVLSCNGGLAAEFLGQTTNVSPDAMNAGGCKIQISELNLNDTVYTLIDNGSVIWNVESVHTLQSSSGTDLQLEVINQLPAALEDGENYTVKFQLLQSRDGGTQPIDTAPIEGNSTANLQMTLEEGPNFSITQATKQGTTYSIFLECNEGWSVEASANGFANPSCEGRDLVTNLWILVGDLQLDHYDSYRMILINGELLDTYLAEQDIDLFLYFDEAGNLIGRQEGVDVTITATGIRIDVISSMALESWQVLLQYDDVNSEDDAPTSVTIANASLTLESPAE